MPLQPHLADQVGQAADTPETILNRIDHLIRVGEWIPDFDEEVAPLPLIHVTRDLY